MTKICSKCKEIYHEPLTNYFNKRADASDGLQSRCKYCLRKERANQYLENIDYYKQKALKHNAEYKLRNLQYMVDYLKQHPCVDCGETDPVVLEFDHQGGKSNNVSEMTTYSLNALAKEIEKCEIRCGNCHKRKTAKQFGFYKGIIL